MFINLKKHRMKNDSQRGFTLIELMIAATVFSTVLLLATTGVINLGKLYHKGITTARTQEATRSITDEVSRSVQLTRKEIKSSASDNNGYQVKCIGSDRYTYSIDKKVERDQKGLWFDEIDGTTCDVSKFAEGRELLGSNMRLLEFEIRSDISDPSKVEINVGVAYGDSDLLTHCAEDTPVDHAGPCDDGEVAAAESQCRPTNSGGAFCAVSKLETFVKRRIPVVYSY